MSIVETLKKDISEVTKKERKKIKINFDGDIAEAIEKLIEQNREDFNIAMQVLPAKELKSYLQKRFKLLQFEVAELESETSKRLSYIFTPKRYNEKPTNDDTVTFLDDLLSHDDIIVSDEEKTSWGKRKVKLSINESSELYTSDKVYQVGNTPKGVKITIKKDNIELLKRPIFTIPGIELATYTKDFLYRGVAIGGKFNGLDRYESGDYAADNKYKVLDLSYFMAICILLENCYMYMDQDTSFMYNSNASYYGLEYTVEDFENLLNFKFLTNQKVDIPEKIKYLICECALAVTHTQMSNILLEEYNKESSSIYAKAFNTKKNIPEKIKAVMRNNNFLELFSYVELDENVDVEKFYLVENEFEIIKNLFKLDRFIKSDAELRFKRLGKHRQSGLYYASTNCICIDIDSPSSFIHELAHLIDNKLMYNQVASLSNEFRLIAIEYRRELEKQAELLLDTEVIANLTDDEIELNKAISKEYKRKKMNYHTPTEIFARAFEIYLVKCKNMISSFLPNVESMILRNGYPALTDSLINKINTYFSNIFELEENINTTSDDVSDTLISNIILNEHTSNEEDNVNILESNNEESNITSLDGEDGSNLIFRIVEDVTNNENGPRYNSRRRRKLNRNAVSEESLASQLTFF